MSSRRHPPWSALRREMTDSPARAFGTVYRRFQESANQAYAARGWRGLTLSHVQLLSETEETGTRLSDIAAALRTTKQYAGRLAKEMAAKRLVSLVADPLDRRAILARPTERGRAFLQDACEVRAELEARYLGRLSASRAAAFVATLKELAAATEG
jgi:DNA-binding MarR family transcriptional regulator